MDKNIYVTQPYMPPLDEYTAMLEEIWESKQLTNCGKFHNQLERALEKHLGVKHVSLFASGTAALVTALKALKVTGEVITTPYSFVATANALLWAGLKPVFVDVDENGNMDYKKIWQEITVKTTAILPVHCYGNRCNVIGINEIARQYRNIKVIYDAAHAFCVKDYRGQSILNHGDLSVLSFHATKVFTTGGEGGAIISKDASMKKHIDHLRNFGIEDETTVNCAGVNGKMTEMQSAFGLLQLRDIDKAIDLRRIIGSTYCYNLSGIEGISSIIFPNTSNYSYYPIYISSEYPLARNELYSALKKNGIYARRYFYPLITEFPMYRDLPSAAPENLPMAHDIASRVLCLPIYPELSRDDQHRIIDIIRSAAC